MIAVVLVAATVACSGVAIVLLYRRLAELKERLSQLADDLVSEGNGRPCLPLAEPSFAFDFDREGRAVSVYTDSDGIDLRGMSPGERIRIGLIIVNSNQEAGV